MPFIIENAVIEYILQIMYDIKNTPETEEEVIVDNSLPTLIVEVVSFLMHRNAPSYVPYLILCFVVCASLRFFLAGVKSTGAWFWAYILNITIALLSIFLSESFSTMFLGFVSLNISLYVIMSRGYIYSIDAALRYFLLGSVAMSLFFFGGAVHLYLYGSFEFSSFTDIGALALLTPSGGSAGLLFSQKLAYFSMFVLFLFKLGVFPFHFYVPSLYRTLNYGVLGLYSIPVKVALFFSFLGFVDNLGLLVVFMYPVFIFIGVGSLFVGTYGAIQQVRLRSFWAYSYISSMGFVFLGFPPSLESATASAYFVHYISIWGIIFLFFGVLGQSSLKVSGIRTKATQFVFISEIMAVGSADDKKPVLLLTLLLSTLAGLPPAVGFVFKFGILSSLASSLLGVLILPSVLMLLPIGAYNYMRLIVRAVEGVNSSTSNFLISSLFYHEFVWYIYTPGICISLGHVIYFVPIA